MLNVATSTSGHPVPPPRVQVATSTVIVRGPDLEQIPESEWVAEPIYAYTHEEIDRDCDGYARRRDGSAGEVDARRARMHRELDEQIETAGRLTDGSDPVASSTNVHAVVSLEREHRKGLLLSYNEWLFYERRLLSMELFPGERGAEGFVPQNTGARDFHFPISGSWQDQPQPSARAAAVLAAAGCDWQGQQHLPLGSEQDPIFALLAEEDALYSASNDALTRDWDGEGQEASDRWNDFWDAMAATRVLSVAGFAALLERWNKRHGRSIENDGLDHEHFQSMIKAGKGDAAVPSRLESEADAVNLLMREWGTTVGELCSAPDDQERMLFDRLNGIERRIAAEPPSLIRAAAIAIFELYPLAGPEVTLADIDRGHEGWASVETLRCLRPYLHGLIVSMTASILDFPDRPICESVERSREDLEADEDEAEPVLLQAAE